MDFFEDLLKALDCTRQYVIIYFVFHDRYMSNLKGDANDKVTFIIFYKTQHL